MEVLHRLDLAFKIRTASGLTKKQHNTVERSRAFIIAKFRCRWPTDPQSPLHPEAQRRIDQEIEVEVEVMEREHYTKLRQFREQAGLSGTAVSTVPPCSLQ